MIPTICSSVKSFKKRHQSFTMNVMDKRLERYLLDKDGAKDRPDAFLCIYEGSRPYGDHVDIQIAGPGSALLIVCDASITRSTWDVVLKALISDKIPGFSAWDCINPLKASALPAIKRTAEKLANALKLGKPSYLIDQYIDLDALSKVFPEEPDTYLTLMDHRLEVSEFLRAFFSYLMIDKGLDSLDCMINFSFS
jgi:hypothetical protein